MNKLHQQLRQEYDEKVELYLKKFGAKSLDRVSLWEPDDYPSDWRICLETAIGELQKSILENCQIELEPENAIY